MKLVNQHVKGIMEECKVRARDAGLTFDDESLEYIVTNRDLIELSPKIMIPTLYDYWVHDVKVLSGKGMYEAYPSNPYETVINTRPAISYYNDNNPDWLNVMIFYHVLGHIDFFQNNLFFENTWDIDLTGQALVDKRMIAKLRAEKGRWLDYTIEFARGIDNLVRYQYELGHPGRTTGKEKITRVDFYFDVFVQQHKKFTHNDYLKEVDRFNDLKGDEKEFFKRVISKYPEFDELYRKETEKEANGHLDVMEYIMRYSPFLKQDENLWMKSVIQIVRNTSLYFQPQIRSKIMNEGWASYWHEYLFIRDDRIKGHEADFAKVNATVTSLPKVGLNPYALGMRMFKHIERMENKGKYSFDYFLTRDENARREFDQKKNTGKDAIFQIRKTMNDFTFINKYIDQEFVDEYNLFVTGKRFNPQRMSWEYYIKSKKAEDYKQMVINTLYHPPDIQVNREKSVNGVLYLDHRFEGKPLKQDYLENTLIGIEFLWGGPVHLETSDAVVVPESNSSYTNFWDPATPTSQPPAEEKPPEVQWKRQLYVMENRKLHKREL